jgi:hypothetical protein
MALLVISPSFPGLVSLVKSTKLYRGVHGSLGHKHQFLYTCLCVCLCVRAGEREWYFWR